MKKVIEIQVIEIDEENGIEKKITISLRELKELLDALDYEEKK